MKTGEKIYVGCVTIGSMAVVAAILGPLTWVDIVMLSIGIISGIWLGDRLPSAWRAWRERTRHGGMKQAMHRRRDLIGSITIALLTWMVVILAFGLVELPAWMSWILVLLAVFATYGTFCTASPWLDDERLTER